MADTRAFLQKNRPRLIILSILLLLFLSASQGMDGDDWLITVLRGLSVGAVTFLVAAGLSLILGLMDVLNLAHGALFMMGAYVGWTVYVRPDTFIDVLPPLLLLTIGFILQPLWRIWISRWQIPSPQVARWWPLVVGLSGGAMLLFSIRQFPITIWDPEVYAQSPITYALALSQNLLRLPTPVPFSGSPWLAAAGVLLGSLLLGLALVGFELSRAKAMVSNHLPRQPLVGAALCLGLGLVFMLGNDALTTWLVGLSTTWRFFLAMLIATLTGGVLGAFIEITLVRPLYSRPIYQIMLTLGLSFIGIELVQTIWGRPEFTMPKPALFNGSGPNCPATNLGGWWEHQCSTILLFGGRIRTYNEIFIIIVGLLVLLTIWLLLQRTRLGMIIRAGVQDREMVQALGINVQQVFTFVFALGVALATLGGVLAGPSLGLSTEMGTRLLLLALIALAIGGLTSFPGAAVGAILVGLMQQFIIRYGQIGITLPFLEEPFKPSPPLVPASTILLMVIILLVMPNGLFGRGE